MTFVNPFAPRRQTAYPEAIDRVKAEARRLLGLDGDDVVSVTEVSCSEPGCPDVETIVAVLRAGEPPRIGRVHKSIPQVEPADILDAFSVVRDASTGD